MVGLSILLEPPRCTSYAIGSIVPKSPQLLDKSAGSIIAAASGNSCSSSRRHESCFSSTAFLEHCFLCKQRLLPGNDIYMYRGDRAFCSVECRSRQIIMDEEESLKKENCSVIADKPSPFHHLPAPSSTGYSRRGGGDGDVGRPGNFSGGFAF